MYLLIEGGVERGLKRVRLHCLSDGRDVQDGSSAKFFQELQDFLLKISKEKGIDAAIASGGGRMAVTMDRYEVGRASSLYAVHVIGKVHIVSSTRLSLLLEACSCVSARFKKASSCVSLSTSLAAQPCRLACTQCHSD